MDTKSPMVDQNLYTMAHLKANTHKFLRMRKNFNLLNLKGKKIARQKRPFFPCARLSPLSFKKQNNKKTTVYSQIIEKCKK